jgi:uncharacterized YccA/Bax inhibitor family protein
MVLTGRSEVQTSNPVLTRLGRPTAQERAAGYGPPGYAPYQTGQGGPVQPYPIEQPGYAPAPPDARPMTLDDVVVRTVALLAFTGAAGAVAWALVPEDVAAVPMLGAAIVGLVLGLVIAFKQVTNPLVIGAYAVVEGVFVGLFTRFFESIYEGIAFQAALGTFGVFFLMVMLYKTRTIRATPKFIRGVIAATLGVVVVMVGNLVLSLFGVNTGLREGGALAIGFSLVVIVIAALTLILDFHMIEEGVRHGLPERYAWICAFGILVSLIWLYIEMLRLLSYLRGD